MVQLSAFLMSICFLLELILISSFHFYPLCQNSERQALLRLKDNFIIDNNIEGFAYPKTKKWKFQDVDCCFWEGVECDLVTGHVIGLDLSSSGLHGFIDSNSSLFNLVHLQKVNLALNNFNYSSIPRQLGNFSRLVYLNLSQSSFSGKIPSEIAKLSKLSTLDLSKNYDNQSHEKFLEIERPRGLERLIHNCTNMEYLRLSGVKIDSDVPHILSNFSRLRHLKLSSCGLLGRFPEFVFRLPNLQVLYLVYNPSLTGCLPEFQSSMPLNALAVSNTLFHGKIPASLGNLDSLQVFDVDNCRFWGIIPNSLQNLTQLIVFTIENNFFSGKAQAFSSNLTQLEGLFLAMNKFDSGEIPPSFTSLSQLQTLDLGFNSFSGEIPQQFCNWSSLRILDLSHNNLSGMIPECFANSSNHLEILNLRGNNFHGPIPQRWRSGNAIKVIALGKNKLVARVPRSLIHCKMLELLDLGGNELIGRFPSWLGSLPELKVLILSSNKFFGGIKNPEPNSTFPKLRVLDLSSNKFSGALPTMYIENWVAMKVEHYSEHLTYLRLSSRANTTYGYIYPYSITLVNKGIRMDYRWIPEALAAIDLSGNKFEGRIPESIGLLSGLLALNLSNNFFSGHIPSSLANLMKLEALDLSQNKLVGEIPLQLTQLNFLEVFNVSHNQLTGPIPQGKQFDAFPNSSFYGNPGLCGSLLTKHCKHTDHEVSPPSHSANDNDSEAAGEVIAWEGVAVGYGIGFLLSLLFAQPMILRRIRRLVKHIRGT